MITNQKLRSIAPKIGWSFIGLLVFVLVVFAIIRSIDTFGGATHSGLFEARYLEHPVVSGIHMATGIAFILLAPMQFMARFRGRHLSLHRGMGRILVSCALLSGLYGIASTLVLPVFGGLPSETASWFFGSLFIGALLRAFWCARQRKIAQHREWMIRAFALALGVGAQRIVLGIIMMSTDHTMYEGFGPSLWLGFGINLIIAETWINLSRRKV